MPEFFYKALTSAGQVQTGWMTAPDELDVEERLRSAGSFLVSAEERAKAKSGPKHTDGKVHRKQLLAFVEYLAGSAQVGMPILTTLNDVQTRLESKLLRKIVGELHHALSEEGKSLSDAMMDHPIAFPTVYIATIEAGEASGRLDFVLNQLVEYLDWQETISGQVKQATMYPLIVLGAVGGLIIVLVAFVFPRILPVLLARSAELPLPTRIVMGASSALRTYWWVLLFFIGSVVFAYRWARKTDKGSLAIDQMLLNMPIFGHLLREVNMARVVTYLGLFYRSGVEVILALSLVERMLTNRIVGNAVRAARDAIEGGATMAAAFSQGSMFPSVVIRSVALGETTGQLDESLARATAYYAREVPAAVRRLITALQPALILTMGSVVLLVALAMILPILSIYNQIGKH
ncbi:MAG: type II secretion system F family protein [Gemmatimonadaceae bacterium]|nr:type II secretion system F family protein [Gemmatimonadaceae bacterium]